MTQCVTCKKCGWVHAAISLDYAHDEARSFVDWYERQTPEVQSNYGDVDYDGLMSNYLHCNLCAALCTNMRPTREGDCPDGVTISGIVAHAELAFATAEKDDAEVQ